MWPEFFHRVLPVAAIVLSVLILASIYAATRGQDAGGIHSLVRVTPLILPVAFSTLWLYAYFFAPQAAR